MSNMSNLNVYKLSKHNTNYNVALIFIWLADIYKELNLEYVNPLLNDDKIFSCISLEWWNEESTDRKMLCLDISYVDLEEPITATLYDGKVDIEREINTKEDLMFIWKKLYE